MIPYSLTLTLTLKKGRIHLAIFHITIGQKKRFFQNCVILTCGHTQLCISWVHLMTPRLPAGPHSVPTPSRWPIKNPPSNIQGEWCYQASPCHGSFTARSLPPAPPSCWATGVSTTCIHTNTWENTHTQTHTHTNAEHLISLLTICRVLIETPLSPSSTCIPSLIISEGAFGEGSDGGGGGRGAPPSLPRWPSCASTDVIEINFAAMCCFSRSLLPSFQRGNS